MTDPYRSFRPPPTAILHIGEYKCGTTTLQRCLDANRDMIAAEGVLVSRLQALPLRHHATLGCYALADDRFPPFPRRFLDVHDAASLVAFRERFEAQIAAEIAERPAGVERILFSYEDLARAAEADIARLLSLFAGPAAEYRRLPRRARSDGQAVSYFNQLVKSGDVGREALLTRGVDHAAVIRRWRDGLDAIAPVETGLSVRLYQRSELVSGDIVADFCAAVGIANATALVRAADANPGLSAHQQDFLAAFNRLRAGSPPADQPDPVRRELVAALQKAGAERGHLPLRAEAEAYLATFAEGNESVRRAYFPERAMLFDEDFSMYPVTLPEPPGFEDAVTVATSAFEALVSDLVQARERSRTNHHAFRVERLMKRAYRCLLDGDEAGARTTAAEVLALDATCAEATALLDRLAHL
ncbi:MAG: hypothetical protein AAFV62_00665 [Pseudomonadota bacterium]